MPDCAIGIDLGGTGIFGAVVTGAGQMLATAERPTPVVDGPEAVLHAMVDMVQGLLNQADGNRVLGIGLGIPGLLDPAAGVSLFSPNLFWRSVPVRAPFAGFGLPVELENDVRCAALGERYFGAGRDVEDFILLTLGTGIGSGIVLGGRLYRGATGLAGEIGHITIRPDGPRCNCGKQGCLEALASGSAIARRSREAGLPYRSALDVAAGARSGDAAACRLLEEVGADLGMGIAACVNLLNPRRVVVGGGVSLAGDLLLRPVRMAAERHTMPDLRGTCDVASAELGDEAGAIGAAALVAGLVGGRTQ